MSNIEDLRVCLFGAGRMGGRHANVVANHSAATLEWIVDVDETKGCEVAEFFDTEYTDAAELALSDADACIISTPEETHAQILELALEHECDVLLEKPIAHNLEEATRICELDDQHNATVLVGHVLRFDPRYRRLKTIVGNEELGTLQSINVRRGIPNRWLETLSSAVHPLVQTVVHELDLIKWLFQDDPTRVYAEEYSSPNGELSGITGVLTHDQGVATVETSFIWPEDAKTEMSSRMELFGTEGKATAYLPDRSCTSLGTISNDADSLLWPEIDGRVGGNIRSQFDHFLECIEGGGPLVTTETAFASLKTAKSMLQSVEEGQPISLNY